MKVVKKSMRFAACLAMAGFLSVAANASTATAMAFGPGNGSCFPIEAGVDARVVGVYGLTGDNFVLRGDGFRAFTDSRVIDCEKGSGVDAYDHRWCEDYSDIDLLVWAGWLQYTGHANEDDYAYAQYLYWEGENPDFKSFYYAAVNAGVEPYNWRYEDINLENLVDIFSKPERLVELYVDFYDYNWYGTVYSGLSHAVVCCGYAIDTTKPLTDPTCLKGLFIIDPDNDRETNGGRAAAPNTITYCPTTWDEDRGQYAIQGIFGATGYVYPWEGWTVSGLYCSDCELGGSPANWSAAVSFNANGGTGGMASQLFTSGAAQNLTPNAFSRWGFMFAGWATSPNGPVVYGDEQSVAVSSSMTLFAVWSEAFAGKADTSFAAMQKAGGALYTGKGVAGTVQVKFGKRSGKNTVKVSATATILSNGRFKKVMAKPVTADAANLSAVVLSFKDPIGDMTLSMRADGTFKLMNATYFTNAATVSGALGGASSRTFILGGFNLAVPGTLLGDLLPYAETFSVAGTRWQFAKAASVKLVKNRTTNTSDLVVDTSSGKTNLSGLKLTYAARTGQFRGSFKAYGLSETNGRKKLTKYTVNVLGFVVNGRGHGEASCKRPVGGPWTVTLK